MPWLHPGAAASFSGTQYESGWFDAEASTVKVFGSEMYVQAYRLLMEVLGQAGVIKAGSPESVIQGRLERMYRASGQALPESKRILELNPTHPLVTGLRDAYDARKSDADEGKVPELA